LRGLDEKDAETVLETDVLVTAGVSQKLPAPQKVTGEAGDRRVLLHWPPLAGIGGYNVYRATNPGGPYTNVNESSQTALVESDLHGNPLQTKEDGFVDFQHWDLSGNPESHEVGGFLVD